MAFSGLYIGARGMTAAQRAMEVAGHNVADAHTEGYTRQRVNLVSSPPSMSTVGAMMGTGVSIADVVRVRNQFVDTAFRAEQSNGAAWGARADILARAEQVLGPLGSGAPDSLNRFLSAWETLSLSPEDPASRQGVIDAGRRIAGDLRAATGQLDTVAREVKAQLSEDVATVDQLAGELARINLAVKDAEIGGQTPNDLYDEQDRIIDRLSDLTGTLVRRGELGQTDVYIGSLALVQGGTASALQIAGDPPLVSFADSGAPVQLAGSMGARLEAAHETLPSLQLDLDAFATGLRDLVNGQHTAGYDLDGAAGLDFFTGAGAHDLDVNVSVGVAQVAASAGGSAADGNNAVAMGGLRDDPAVGTSTAVEALATLGSRLGSLAREADHARRSSDVVLTNRHTERAATNSVSTDEELTDMIRYQRAYEASARVITAVDEMLDVLVNRTGLVGR